MICFTLAGQQVEVSDPEILALVVDLDLVPGPRLLFFCERWKIFKERQRKMSLLLCRELAKRNQKYSRYVYPSFVDTPSRYHQGKVFRCGPMWTLPGMSFEETR